MASNAGLHSWSAKADRSEADCDRVLSWDGRIDNRRELCARLESAGARHATPVHRTDDATLLLAAYQTWGIAGLAKVVGDWSVVLRDAGRNEVIAASDYMGVRPLFYRRGEETVFWATQLKALLETQTRPQLNSDYIAAFLSIGCCASDTPYCGIKSVPPGHALRFRHDETEKVRFWESPILDEVRYKDERRYDEQFLTLFADAVRARLQGPQPVLLELSGGLDSSSIVCMASQLIDAAEVGASRIVPVSYVHAQSKDARYIAEVERHCGLESVRFRTTSFPLIDESEVGDAVPEAWAPLYKGVAATASIHGASTLLTGQSGDLLTGNWLDDSHQVSRALSRLRIGRAFNEAKAWSESNGKPLWSILAGAMRAMAPTDLSSAAFWGAGSFASGDMSLQPDFARHDYFQQPAAMLSPDWKGARPERRRHFFLLTLMRELRMLQRPESTPFLNVSHPFAHRPLVEFLMSIPSRILCGPSEPRRLMRRAFGNLWPPALRGRRSKGLFELAWLEALRPLAQRLIRAPRLQVVERGWIERQSLQARLERLTHGQQCGLAQLRQIILLEYWLEHRAHLAA